MVPTPTLSGPTSGRVEEEELAEWAWQARRWTIGAAEVFHYFMIKARRIPKGAALCWGAAFLFYYGILLCCSHLYGVAMVASYFIYEPEETNSSSSISSSSSSSSFSSSSVSAALFFGGVLGVYINSALMFALDALAPKLLVPRPKERISLLRNLLHFVLSPIVIAAYSLVEFLALNELAVRGKKVCGHRPSKKTDLVGTPLHLPGVRTRPNVSLD